MTPEQLRLRDEILQLMFWLRGEGLEEMTDQHQLAIFLPEDSQSIGDALHWMCQQGLLIKQDRGTYSLSAQGIEEGGKRFAEEFADAGILAGGHGTCAPGCDCELHGPEYCDHRHE